MAFVSKAFRRCAGEVDWMEGGPRWDVEDVQISSRPQEFSTSSINASVASSEVML